MDTKAVVMGCYGYLRVLFPNICEEVMNEFSYESAWMVNPGNQLGNHLKRERVSSFL